MSENIKDAIRKAAAAKAHLRDEVAKTFPVGADVSWNKRGYRQHGSVTHHGGIGRSGQLRVENNISGKCYWITMYDILGYVG